MRTTLSIDKHLLARAKERARREGITLGTVVEIALRRELARVDAPAGPPVDVFRGGTGAAPGIDLSSNRAIAESLDAGLDLERLR